jgi:hypothetical protein
MRKAHVSLYIICICCMLGCTKQQELLPASSFINLEVSLRSVDQKASYTLTLDDNKIQGSLKTTTILSKVVAADTALHRLVLKNNRRPNMVIDTLVRLAVPASRFSVVETDTSGKGRPLFIRADSDEGDVPKGQTQVFMAWKKSPYFPTPSVPLPDSIQVLLYTVDVNGAIKKPPSVFNIPVNGDIRKAPALLQNDPSNVSYIMLFKNPETGKFLQAMSNTAVGSVFDWTAGILLPPMVEMSSRYAYFDICYSNQGGGMYGIDAYGVLEY